MATTGETRVTKPASSGDASYSVCPLGWRLPTGGAGGELAVLNARMNNPGSISPSIAHGDGFYQKWQYSGPFRGVMSGKGGASGFTGQGVYGSFWSRTTEVGSSQGAHRADISTIIVLTVGEARGMALAIRCLTN